MVLWIPYTEQTQIPRNGDLIPHICCCIPYTLNGTPLTSEHVTVNILVNMVLSEHVISLNRYGV